jgi:hypothetical protein
MSGIQELLRERAYELWQQAGTPEGRSDEFWFAAERELEDTTATAEGEAGVLVLSVEERTLAAYRIAPPAGV